MSTNNTRALLAIIALLSVIGAGAFAFFCNLTPVQQNFLTMIVTALVTKVGASFNYYFDGTPAKPNYPATTSIGVQEVPPT
jgi:hypothetical protein